jgi:hypothetical protein
MQFLEISWDFGILEFSKILEFFQRFFGFLTKCTKIFRVIYPSGLYFMPSVIPAGENHENKTFFAFYNNLLRNGFLSLVVIRGHSNGSSVARIGYTCNSCLDKVK